MPPRLAKLLAVVAAVVMIGAALWIRSRGGDDDGGSSTGASGRRFRVVCVTELDTICQQLRRQGIDAEVEEAGTTADALGQGAPGYDAWITIDPWPAMVDAVRQQHQQPDVFDPAVPIASSDLALLLASKDLSNDCGWDCVVAASGQQQEIAIPSEDSGLGPQLIANAFSSHLKKTDFSRADIEDPAGKGWLDRLLASAPASDAERRMATEGAAAYIAAGTTEQAAQPAISSASGTRRGLHFGSPELVARADVVVATVAGRQGTQQLVARLRDKNAREAFRGAGWSAPAVGGPTGLPAADLLVALREEVDR
ncbi:MAG: hypothetical protein JO291_02890 [Acidimicrobiia bacterium]|nr:hypothetical protein [Acidimicrobiia bacterium]